MQLCSLTLFHKHLNVTQRSGEEEIEPFQWSFSSFKTNLQNCIATFDFTFEYDISLTMFRS